jgi:nucleolar protein 15
MKKKNKKKKENNNFLEEEKEDEEIVIKKNHEEENEEIIPLKKNLKKKIYKQKENNLPNEEEESSVIYIGHIPHGFYEEQMFKYFKQFGFIESLRLHRSRKTGKSKGYAFIKFSDPEVAKIVAATMNNYLLFERRLKVHVVPKEKLKKGMYKKKKNSSTP